MSLINKNLDNFIILFSKNINILKIQELENKFKLSKKHQKIFNKLLNILIKREKYALDQNLWSELYMHSIYFYKKINKIHDIPLVMVTKHNHILQFYMKKKLKENNFTILHFDTHPDMNNIKDSSVLPKLYKKYIKSKNNIYLEKAEKIVWDIGAAISGVLFTTGIQNYVWCMPEWIPDPNIISTYFLKEYKKNIYAYSNDHRFKNDILCDLSYTSKINEENNSTYAKIQTGKFQKNITNKLIEIINNNDYILDIDLDYFVCNGDKLIKKDYFKDPYDIMSLNRTRTIMVNENNPRDKTYDTKELDLYSKNIKKEIKLIDKRIQNFLKIIKELKDKNHIPKYISICDSTNIEFSFCTKCNTISNGYVPTNLALYVHIHIFNGLYKIFK
jgi:hypothetical protein